MGKQPGVMLYFDLRDSLDGLSCEDKGKLLDAILDYGKYGVVPEFSGMLKMAWNFIRPRVDQDRDRYERLVNQRRGAAASRWSSAPENHADASSAMRTMPNTNTNTNTTTNTKTNTNTTTPNGPQKRGRWVPKVPLEEEVERLNQLAREGKWK